MTFYQCEACGWAAERVPQLLQACERCKARGVRLLSEVEFAALVKAGEVVKCKACNRLHTGPISRAR